MTRWGRAWCAAAATLVVLSMGGVAAADGLAEAAGDLSKMASVIRWSGVLASAFVIAFAAITLRAFSGVLRRLSDRYTDRRLTLQQVASVARFVVYIVTASVVIALSVRIDDKVLTLLGGTLAVSVGFAMRDLVASVIAGVIIMLDRPFQVGDRVEYAGAYGDIVAIGLRSVRMHTLDENTVTIPNNKILTDITSSVNYGVLDMQVNIDLYLGVEEDFVLAERLLREAIIASNFVYLAQPVIVGIAERLDKGRVLIQLRGKASVFDTAYEKAFVSEVTRRALLAFKEHGMKVG
jgi:small-conductance mechanosensitive channel